MGGADDAARGPRESRARVWMSSVTVTRAPTAPRSQQRRNMVVHMNGVDSWV